MAKRISLLQRAATSLANALTRRGKRKTSDSAKRTAGDGNGSASKQPRRPRLQTDIPLDQLSQAYTPTQTSLKGPFRTTGADRSRDQEFARGYSDDRWNEEDLYTNKSGDPRIGTHGRTYEPGEKE